MSPKTRVSPAGCRETEVKCVFKGIKFSLERLQFPEHLISFELLSQASNGKLFQTSMDRRFGNKCRSIQLFLAFFPHRVSYKTVGQTGRLPSKKHNGRGAIPIGALLCIHICSHPAMIYPVTFAHLPSLQIFSSATVQKTFPHVLICHLPPLQIFSTAFCDRLPAVVGLLSTCPSDRIPLARQFRVAASSLPRSCLADFLSRPPLPHHFLIASLLLPSCLCCTRTTLADQCC